MAETVPVRLQLRRMLGFNLQAASLAANGLPAVNVMRWIGRRVQMVEEIGGART